MVKLVDNPQQPVNIATYTNNLVNEMSKATTQLMKRYISILNITNGNRYLGSEDVMGILKSDYSIDVARRVVQRDLNDLYSVGAIERKGNAPISWRSTGIQRWADVMASQL